MVIWIGRFFTVFAALKRRLDGEENAEILTRGETALDPNTPENREKWNTTAQVNNHESLFSFRDNYQTLMFIVVSGLTEAQRERLTSSLSLKGLNIIAYTFEAVRTTFLELICTPKGSMESPSLRVWADTSAAWTEPSS